ncbi:MAG: alternative ribosome rescue aminoacyl-tRNA hydrolase ArfB [Burkholderiaceae bacterium]|nr:alternative ribosome rescue aminoacyl-tRNA hydrolase ArfB [Burkholderiaceae bacterium]
MKRAAALPFSLREEEVRFDAVRAQGAGGQNVNKVASAVQLRFDVRASSLPEAVKARLLARREARIGRDGVIVIKAQEARTQARNRAAALARLRALLEWAAHVPRPRRATRPPASAARARLDAKRRRGELKAQRRRQVDT